MVQQQAPALARETFAWTEFVHLMADPVYYGAGVPRGDGRLVLVLPGLFGNDWYLQPLRSWLNRIGYRAVPSTLTVNAGCPERLTREVEKSLERRVRRPAARSRSSATAAAASSPAPSPRVWARTRRT